jgi:hypothetical protein
MVDFKAAPGTNFRCILPPASGVEDRNLRKAPVVDGSSYEDHGKTTGLDSWDAGVAMAGGVAL